MSLTYVNGLFFVDFPHFMRWGYLDIRDMIENAAQHRIDLGQRC